MSKKVAPEVLERRDKVYSYYLKGYTPKQISVKLKSNIDEVRKDLKAVKATLRPKSVAALEYRRNKSLASLNMLKQKAWEILDKSTGRTAIMATAVINRIEANIAQVQGLMAEKIIIPPKQEVNKLYQDIYKLEEETHKDGGNGHKEEEKVY